MRNSAYAKPFNLDFKSISDVYTFIEEQKKALKFQKMSKN